MTKPLTVISCTPTQDGNHLIVAAEKPKAPVIVRSHPKAIAPGSRVKLQAGGLVLA